MTILQAARAWGRHRAATCVLTGKHNVVRLTGMSSAQSHADHAGARFCFVCGHALNEGLLATEERVRLYCPRCGYVHYVNPKVVCGTLPQQDGKVWLLRRGIEPRLGYWTYPAGFQEIDESTEEGALRETVEELGCPVAVRRLLGIYSRPHAPVNVVYLADIVPALGTPRLTPEAIEVRSFLPGEIPWEDLAFLSTRDVLRDWARLAASGR